MTTARYFRSQASLASLASLCSIAFPWVLCTFSIAGCAAGSDNSELGQGGASGSAGTAGTSNAGTSGTGGSSGSSGSSGSAGNTTGGAAGESGAAGTSGSGGTAAGGAGGTAGSAGSAGSGAGGSGGTAGAGGGGGVAGSGGNSFGGAAGSSGSAGSAGSSGSSGSAGSAGSAGCAGPTSVDNDNDGYSEDQGDCNDCDPVVHPGAIDVVNYVTCTAGSAGCVCDANNMNCKAVAPTQIDESCGHTAPTTCDAGLALTDVVAADGAKSIDICATVANNGYGLVSAAYVRVDGSPLTPGAQVGIMPTFGANVPAQLGSNMLVLSSGRARTPGQSGACTSTGCLGSNSMIQFTGYPQNATGCTVSNKIYDDVALELHLKAPSNATGFKYRFKYHTFEFPSYVCSDYNDQFLAWMSPAPAAAINGNISFDANHNPVSVNVAYFDVCNPASLTYYGFSSPGSPTPPNPYCPSGDFELQGTGFESGGAILNPGGSGATSWLYTQAPVTGGEEFTLRLAIWDTGDKALDSTVLIDGFEWIADGTTVTVTTGKEDP